MWLSINIVQRLYNVYITIATVEIWLYATCSIHILLGIFKSQKGEAKKKITIAFTKGVHHTPPPLPHWKITLYIQNQENLKNKKKELKTSEYFYNECITIIQGKIQLPWVLSELWFFNGKKNSNVEYYLNELTY